MFGGILKEDPKNQLKAKKKLTLLKSVLDSVYN